MDALAGYDSEGSESNDSAFIDKPRPFPLQNQVPVVFTQPHQEDVPQPSRESPLAATSGLQAEMLESTSVLQPGPELKPCLGEPSTPSQAGRDKRDRPYVLNKWPLQDKSLPDRRLSGTSPTDHTPSPRRQREGSSRSASPSLRKSRSPVDPPRLMSHKNESRDSKSPSKSKRPRSPRRSRSPKGSPKRMRSPRRSRTSQTPSPRRSASPKKSYRGSRSSRSPSPKRKRSRSPKKRGHRSKGSPEGRHRGKSPERRRRSREREDRRARGSRDSPIRRSSRDWEKGRPKDRRDSRRSPDRRRRRSRSRSPPREARRRSKSPSPERKHSSSRSPSPQKSKSGSKSKVHLRSRSRSKSLSPARSKSRSRSRSPRRQSRSPRRRSRTRSPFVQKRSRSPRRRHSRSPPPRRDHRRSPLRRRSPIRGMWTGRGRGRGRRRSPVHRNRSGSSSGSASPTGDPALDAQEALRRRLERAKKKQKEKAEKEKAEMEAKLESGEAAAGAPPSIVGINPLLAGQQVTPQEAVCAAARAMQIKVAAETGIQVPSYYNPTAVNPMKYAEQMQKRKLLWAGKKEKKEGDVQPGTVWDKTKFQDEATQAKFRRLMGIHGEASSSGDSVAPVEGPDIQQEQEKLFRTLEAQYEFARGTTHTQKGVGLGFSSARQPGPTL